jgi:hypothetical protein
LLKELREQEGPFLKQAPIAGNALLPSYKTAYRAANCKKPHSVKEELILSTAVDMANVLFGESAGRLLSKVPLSNNTISRTIQLMAEDLNDQ